jgi:hypothetical protein
MLVRSTPAKTRITFEMVAMASYLEYCIRSAPLNSDSLNSRSARTIATAASVN